MLRSRADWAQDAMAAGGSKIALYEPLRARTQHKTSVPTRLCLGASFSDAGPPSCDDAKPSLAPRLDIAAPLKICRVPPSLRPALQCCNASKAQPTGDPICDDNCRSAQLECSVGALPACLPKPLLAHGGGRSLERFAGT